MQTKRFEYLENEEGMLDEIKIIFHNYLKAIIWWKNEKQQTQALTRQLATTNTIIFIESLSFQIHTTQIHKSNRVLLEKENIP